MVRLTDRPDMTLDVYRGRKTTIQQQHVTADNSTRLFGSVVENWIIEPAAWVRFPLKSWDFFQPNLLCFVLCCGFHVVRNNKYRKVQI